MRWGVLLVSSFIASVTVLFAQTTIFSENFATTNPGSIPAGWVLGDGGDVRDQAPPLNYDSTWTVVSNYNGNDLGHGKFLFIGYNPGGRQADTITTPLINANVKGWLYLAYLTYYDNLDANDSGMVQVFDGLNWREVKKYGAATGDVGGWGNQAAWQVINITDYISSALRVRFIYHDNNNLYWAIDSVIIYNTCDPPRVDVEWITMDTVELTFYPSYDSLLIEYGPAGFLPGTGTSFIIVPTSQTIKIGGLNHAQDYEFYVRGFCGSTVSINPTVYYLCKIQPLPYYEDFETTPKWEVPQCWKAYPNEGADTVGVDNTAGCVYGTQSLVIFGGQGQGFWALAPYVNTQNLNSVRASFRYRAGTNNTCGNSPETQDSLFLEVWTGNTWEKVLGFGGSAAQTFIHANAYIPTSNMDMLRVRFRAVGSGPSYDNWYVDSFLITVGPCIKPMSVSASFNNSNDTIIVSWGLEGSDSIVIEYGFPGFAVGSGNRIYVDVQSSNTVRIPVPFGSYEVYVWGQCNGQGSIDTFYSLLCGPISTPALETFDNGRYFEACWAQTIDYAAKIDTCLSDGGHLFLWGKNNSVVTSPAYYTQQNKVHKISYYYRTGGNSCGDVPEKGDKLTINISNNGTLWNTLVQMDGFFDHSPNWQYREYYVCSNTSELYLQFSTTGLGIGYDSWHIDSLYVGPTSNSPDVIVVDVVANNGLVCDSGYFGTIGIVYRNVGNSPVDTVVVGYRLNGSLFLDTVYYASGFGGGCANFTDLDTAYIPLSVSGVGVYPITTFARAISNDGNPTDTFRHNLVVGDKFLYIGIGTASYSSEIYWKLFYLPDSQLVMSVPSGTYTNNSYTVDSVCALSGALYRFEAWDSYGDGWNGGYFDLFVKAICGDTAFITQYNYVGSIPGKLEKIFYFSIPQTDSAYNIRIVDLLSSTTLSICGDTFNEPITVSFQNIGINALDTVLVGINLSNVVSKIDTLIYTGGFKPCEVDTYTIFNPALYDYIGRLDVWTTTPADQNKLNDSIRTGIAAGTRWTYVKITTGSYAHEVYWKLFMVPDSVLVGYVPNGTYNASNSTFVDSVCLANHYNYRFEAWDWAGNGWSGGTYELYTYTDCSDYIFLINNNGNPVPNTPSTFLETVEYFTLDVDSNIALLSMTPDTATYICSSSHTITVNIKNTDGSATLNVPVTLNELISGFNTTQTVTVGPCQSVPVQFNPSFPNIGAMHYIATANIPSDPYLADNDTLSVELYYLPADSFDAYFSASIDATARCLGDTVRITLPQAILYQEDFEGSPSNLWNDTLGTMVVTTDSSCFGSPPSGTFLAYFRDGGSGPRGLVTKPLNGRKIKAISFYLSLATQSNCNRPEQGEDVTVEYSVDGGITWNEIYRVGIQTQATGAFVYHYVELPFPARVNNLLLRIVQHAHSDALNDLWALDMVQVHTLTDSMWLSPQLAQAGSQYIAIIQSDTTIYYHVFLNNSCHDIDTFNVSLAPTPQLTLPRDTAACDKQLPIILDATPTDQSVTYTYQWNTGATTPQIAVNQAGTYIVTVTSSIGQACTTIDTVDVIVHQSPVASINGPVLLYVGDVDTFYAQPTGPEYSYYWNTGATTEYLVYRAQQQGTDTLWVIVTDQNNCSDTATHIIGIMPDTTVATTVPSAKILFRYNHKTATLIIQSDSPIKQIAITTMDGKLLTIRQGASKEAIVPLSNLPQGVYHIKLLLSTGQTASYKIVKVAH